MITEIAVRAFTSQASITPNQYVRRFTRFKPSKATQFQLIDHLINEANSKLLTLENLLMSKNKKNQSNNYDVSFCTISLDTEGKELARGWLKANEKDLDQFFADLIRDDWKTSISFDSYNDCFIAASTQRDDDNKNHNVCVTSRSDNLFEAIMLNYYKINILFEGRKLPVEKEKMNWG